MELYKAICDELNKVQWPESVSIAFPTELDDYFALIKEQSQKKRMYNDGTMTAERNQETKPNKLQDSKFSAHRHECDKTIELKSVNNDVISCGTPRSNILRSIDEFSKEEIDNCQLTKQSQLGKGKRVCYGIVVPDHQNMEIEGAKAEVDKMMRGSNIQNDKNGKKGDSKKQHDLVPENEKVGKRKSKRNAGKSVETVVVSETENKQKKRRKKLKENEVNKQDSLSQTKKETTKQSTQQVSNERRFSAAAERRRRKMVEIEPHENNQTKEEMNDCSSNHVSKKVAEKKNKRGNNSRSVVTIQTDNNKMIEFLQKKERPKRSKVFRQSSNWDLPISYLDNSCHYVSTDKPKATIKVTEGDNKMRVKLEERPTVQRGERFRPRMSCEGVLTELLEEEPGHTVEL